MKMRITCHLDVNVEDFDFKLCLIVANDSFFPFYLFWWESNPTFGEIEKIRIFHFLAPLACK